MTKVEKIMAKVDRKFVDIINLTQHNPTPEQVADGVVDYPHIKAEVKELLTFNDIPSQEEILRRAEELTNIVKRYDGGSAMIGGAPYLMGTLEQTLKKARIQPLYSFTERVSVENNNPDGSVTKTAVFKHKGWVVV